MRILYATMQFARGYSQGTERYLSILARGMLAAGHEVVVLGGDPLQREAPRALGAVVPHELAVRHYPTSGWMATRGLPASQFGPLLDEIRPDLVHVANPAHIGLGLAEAALARNLPLVLTVMDYWWLCPKQTLRHWQRGLCDGQVPWSECLRCIASEDDRGLKRLHRSPALSRVALPLLYFGRWLLDGRSPGEVARWPGRRRYISDVVGRAAALILPSRTAGGLVGPWIDAARRYSIPYGLEPVWFADRPARPLRAGRLPVLGYSGAIEAHKGVHHILAALAELGWRDVPVRIAGAGKDPAYVERLHREAAGLRAEFVGLLPADGMRAFLDGLDALIVPSTWPENLPLAVLEAFARGLPVLASRVGGIAEVVDARHLFDVDSTPSLAACLRRWREETGEFVPPRVSTAAEMIAATSAVYDSARSSCAG